MTFDVSRRGTRLQTGLGAEKTQSCKYHPKALGTKSRRLRVRCNYVHMGIESFRQSSAQGYAVEMLEWYFSSLTLMIDGCQYSDLKAIICIDSQDDIR